MTDDLLTSLEAILAGMDPAKKQQLVRAASSKLRQIWLPNPGKQTEAYLCRADWLLYGGSAGGGKTDLLLGTALTSHRHAVIFRRQGVDLRGTEERLIEILGTREGYNAQDMKLRHKGGILEFGALEKPGSEFTWQGRPHDMVGFDEGAQLSLQKVLYVTGWLRSTVPGQHKRIIIATNPPMGGEGEWIIEWWAPWLDPAFPDPALPGELRWAIIVEQKIRWVEGPGKTVVNGHTYSHESYTFIPASLADNPYLKDSGYQARLENLPEPLRSQLLYGDFLAGREDHEWQIIPTAWVKAAQHRHRLLPVRHRTMIALAMDIAMGGPDDTTIAKLYEDAYFGPLKKVKGVSMDDPNQHAVLIIQERRDGADISVDGTGGWGTGVASHLRHQHEIEVTPIVFSKASKHKAKDGKLAFANLRAEMHWRFREALEPDSSEDVALPPDARLMAQLTTPRYFVRGTTIHVESKEDIRKRTGSSTDDSDAVIMAWHRRAACVRKARREVPGLPLIDDYHAPVMAPGQNDGWLLA